MEAGGSQVRGHSGMHSKPRLHSPPLNTHTHNPAPGSDRPGHLSVTVQEAPLWSSCGETQNWVNNWTCSVPNRASIFSFLQGSGKILEEKASRNVSTRGWEGAPWRARVWTWHGYQINEPAAAVVPSRRPSTGSSKIPSQISCPAPPLTEELVAMAIARGERLTLFGECGTVKFPWSSGWSHIRAHMSTELTG